MKGAFVIQSVLILLQGASLIDTRSAIHTENALADDKLIDQVDPAPIKEVKLSPDIENDLTNSASRKYTKRQRTDHVETQSTDQEAISEPPTFIEVLSSATRCHVKVNGRTVMLQDKRDLNMPDVNYMWRSGQNGMYAVALHPETGRRTGQAFAHGNTPNAAFFSLEELFRNTQTGRPVVLCVLAESGLSLDDHGERLMKAINSSWAPDLQAKSMFGLIAVKDGPVLAEGYSMNLAALYPGYPSPTLKLTALVPRRRNTVLDNCRNEDPQWSPKRRQLCDKYDGYRGLCRCPNPVPLEYPINPFPDGRLFEYPIIILASNRPRYLFRCFTSLLANRGLDVSKVVVFVDGEHDEVQELLEAMGVTMHSHVIEETILDTGTKIASNYRYTMETAFNMFPQSSKIVLLEEDLEVSPDFVSFFQQTHHLLDIDYSLYCISAWNDHGYNHTVGDATMLYRVGFLPGLGWMLTREMFFEEMLPVWPPYWRAFDWDVMFRLPQYRKGRDCVIPDVPRTYHFGFEGNHVGAVMQFKYYYDHALNRIPNVQLRDVDKMVYHKYEGLLIDLLKNGTQINGNDSNSTACGDLVPTSGSTPYIIFIKMQSVEDTGVWEKLSTCLNLWDLDVRGDHRGIWRFWYNKSQVMVVGVPYSDLARFGINNKGEVMIFDGHRTARAKSLGRWPPGLQRDLLETKTKRFRFAEEEVELNEGGGNDTIQTRTERHQ